MGARRRDAHRARVAIARGPAFSFHYEENLELLRGAGAELVEFDPLHDEALPEADALILAGGFPEVFGAELAANPLKHDIAAFTGPILAECGGLLYLARRRWTAARCAACSPVEAHMTDRLTLGYREAVSLSDHPVWPRGHEDPRPRVPLLARERRGHARGSTSAAARATSQGLVHASYLHTHWAATPEVATRLISAVRESVA